MAQMCECPLQKIFLRGLLAMAMNGCCTKEYLSQGRAETFGGAGAQSIKGAHGTQLLIGLCSLLIYVYRNGCFCIDTAANAMTQV